MSLFLKRRLERKVEQALSATWEHTQPVAISLDPPPSEQPDGSLLAGASFSVQRRDGSWKEIHREQPVTLADEDAVDDFLARGLSVLLMKHPIWPH